MTPEIVKPNGSNSPRISAATMEKLLIKGDLNDLAPAQRVEYYLGLCESLGLNPLSKPFDYIELNRKLVLYAKRECTDQLRKRDNISLVIKSREVVQDCYVVTVTATMPSGRTDESIGAVAVDSLRGENRANALMKAETKAKRRVTLSICGLSMSDESELDSIADKRTVTVNHETGEIETPPAPQPAAPLPPKPSIADELKASFDVKTQIRLFGDLKAGFQTLDREAWYYDVLRQHGVSHANEFKDRSKAASCYRALTAALVQAEQAREYAEMDQRQPGEGE